MDSLVDQLDDYELRHLISHLAKAGAQHDLHRLLGLVNPNGRNDLVRGTRGAWRRRGLLQVDTVVSALKEARGEQVGYLARQAIAAVGRIMPDDNRAVRLGALVSRSPPEYLEDAIRIAADIPNEGSRLVAFRALAPRLAPDLLPKAWQVAQDFDQIDLRAGALAALATRFSGAEVDVSVRSILGLVRQQSRPSDRRTDWQSGVLVELARSVPQGLMSEVVETAQLVLGQGEALMSLLPARIGRGAASA